MRSILALLLVLAHPALAQHKKPEHAAAYYALREIQQRSVEESREYCGFIGYDSAGVLRTTPASPGTLASCTIKPAPRDWTVVASYHSHGGWTEQYDDEVPSPTDMYSDINSQTNGYVGTPGGRIWFFDWQRRVAVQLCGLGCLYQDPIFTTRGSRSVRDRYAFEQLLNRFGE
ncbi:protein of unknown function [Monaibacterium marinum]|uniref:DUF4329 domain-containing protein n=1 Tax=Pontivivens marinum TaxID=1690039 RepID=A0A2C9CU26_9RHOB|nr:DUF4329 domain-containing protein [Monaibacterium marinum]SOH94772.1 protein of unknown function [Monaibacterium marinum]